MMTEAASTGLTRGQHIPHTRHSLITNLLRDIRGVH